MKKVILLLLLVNGYLTVFAQNKLVVKVDPLIDSLVKKYQEINTVTPHLDGYRIQIFTGADRNNAVAIRNKFLTPILLHTTTETIWPNFNSTRQNKLT